MNPGAHKRSSKSRRSKRQPRYTRGKEVSQKRRIATSMHPSLEVHEDLWLCIPISEDLFNKISSIVIFKKEGGMISMEVSNSD